MFMFVKRKYLSHIEKTKGRAGIFSLSPMCVCIWLLRRSSLEKVLSQWVHGKGFSLDWTLV